MFESQNVGKLLYLWSFRMATCAWPRIVLGLNHVLYIYLGQKKLLLGSIKPGPKYHDLIRPNQLIQFNDHNQRHVNYHLKHT